MTETPISSVSASVWRDCSNMRVPLCVVVWWLRNGVNKKQEECITMIASAYFNSKLYLDMAALASCIRSR